jgi:DNA-binding NarL/FixJ family response regulator
LTAIYNKTGVSNRMELALCVTKNHLLEEAS